MPHHDAAAPPGPFKQGPLKNISPIAQTSGSPPARRRVLKPAAATRGQEDQAIRAYMDGYVAAIRCRHSKTDGPPPTNPFQNSEMHQAQWTRGFQDGADGDPGDE